MTGYKRLTQRGKYGYVIEPYTQCAGDLKTVVDRLARLENQLENGELLTQAEHLKRCKEMADRMCADCASNKERQAKQTLTRCQELIKETCDKCQYKMASVSQKKEKR